MGIATDMTISNVIAVMTISKVIAVIHHRAPCTRWIVRNHGSLDWLLVTLIFEATHNKLHIVNSPFDCVSDFCSSFLSLARLSLRLRKLAERSVLGWLKPGYDHPSFRAYVQDGETFQAFNWEEAVTTQRNDEAVTVQRNDEPAFRSFSFLHESDCTTPLLQRQPSSPKQQLYYDQYQALSIQLVPSRTCDKSFAGPPCACRQPRSNIVRPIQCIYDFSHSMFRFLVDVHLLCPSNIFHGDVHC